MSDYDYGNARVRAMTSRLLSRRDMDALAEQTTLDGLQAALARTSYGPSVETAIIRRRGLDAVREALRHDLRATVGRMPAFYAGRARLNLLLVLRRWDIHNLKTVLRGLETRAPADDIAVALVPIGELDDALLDQLVRAPDARAATDLLLSASVRLAGPILELRARSPGAPLAAAELALDRWYYLEALAASDGREELLVTALRHEADAINLLTMLRFAADAGNRRAVSRWLEGEGLEALFVPGGSVPVAQLALAASRESVAEAVKGIDVPFYADALQAGLAEHARSGRLSDVERALERRRLRWYAGLMLRDPLGIGVPLAYIALKTNEAANLRWIAHGIVAGLAPDAIRAELEWAA